VLGRQARNARLPDGGAVWHSHRGRCGSVSCTQYDPRIHQVFCIYQYAGSWPFHSISMWTGCWDVLLLRWLWKSSSFFLSMRPDYERVIDIPEPTHRPVVRQLSISSSKSSTKKLAIPGDRGEPMANDRWNRKTKWGCGEEVWRCLHQTVAPEDTEQTK